MKTTVFLMAVILALPVVASAQANPRGTAEEVIAGQAVSVEYGRPSLKGRDMLAKAPVGTVWRMGADKSTTLTTEADLQFGDVTIPQGAYSLFANRVADDKWELVFNEQVGQWGTEHDASKDLDSVPLDWEKADSNTEMFTIEIAQAGDGGQFKMMWGEHILSAPFTVK